MVRSERHSDLWLLSVASAALCFEVLYLFWLLRIVDIPLPGFLQSSLGSRSGDSIGMIAEKRLSVRTRSQSSLTWLPTASGDGIFARDTVMTGIGSTAILQLSDGSRVELGPNSLIHFPASSQGATFLELELNRGKIRLLSGGLQRKVRLNTRSIIVSPASEVVVETNSLSGRASVELVNGKAAMASKRSALMPKDLIEIKAGDSLQILSSGSVEVGPTLPKPPPVLAPTPKYQLIAPQHSSLKETRTIVLQWKTVQMAEKYAVEIARDKDFRNIVTKRETAEPSIEWVAEGAGDFFWRVTAETTGVDALPSSEVQHFYVRSRIAAPKPKGAKVITPQTPAPSKSQKSPHGFRMKVLFFLCDLLEPRAMAQDEKLRMEFNWEKVRGARKYLLQVSTTSDFGKKKFEFRISDSRTRVDLPAAKAYFWRVAGIDEDGDLGKFSEVQKMDATQALSPASAPVLKPVVVTPKQSPPPTVPLEPARNLAQNSPPTKESPFTIAEVKVGYGGGWALQRGSAGVSEIRSSGVAWNAFKAGLQITQGDWVGDLGIGFQPWRYRSENPEIADFQPNLTANRWEAFLLAHKKNKPWFGGLRYRREGELQKTGAETVSIGDLSYFALVAGRRWQLIERVSGNAESNTDDGWWFSSQLELAPVGPRRGVSVELKSSYRFGSYFEDWAPIWEISLYPYYRLHSLTQRPEWTAEWSSWLWIAWKFDAPKPELISTTGPSQLLKSAD